MKKISGHEKVSNSVLCYKIFKDIAQDEYHSYEHLVISNKISKQSVGEALGYLQEQKLIKKRSPPDSKDKRLIQIYADETGFQKFYEKWVLRNYSPSQLEYRIKRTGSIITASDRLMKFFIDWGDRPGIMTFGHFFVLYDYWRAPAGKMKTFIG